MNSPSPQTGQPVDDFQLPSTADQPFQLKAHRGRNIVLYFYPRDDTPGCTLESKEFRDPASEFDAEGTLILGVSGDPVKSHDRFRAKFNLPFDLLADTEAELCNYFNVRVEKNMYGRTYLGIDRSTFLVDGRGVLRREWRRVRPEGHAAEVLAAVRELGH